MPMLVHPPAIGVTVAGAIVLGAIGLDVQLGATGVVFEVVVQGDEGTLVVVLIDC